MATFVTDTFTDTGGTTLASHTGEVGATWTKDSTDPAQISNANRLRDNNAGGVIDARYRSSGSPATNEYDVQVDYVNLATQATGCACGVSGRTTGYADGYFAYYDTDAGYWELTQAIGAAYTSLGTYSQALSTNTTYTLKLEIRSASKKVYIDGVERISSATDNITSTGKAGVILVVGSVMGDTTGPHLDNFSAVDAPSGGGGGVKRLTLLGAG